MKRHIVASLLLLGALSACTLMPHYQRPQSPVPNRWPADAGKAAAAASASVSADQIGWRDFFADPKLQRLVEIALENNRNLRIAVLNVAASEAQFRVERSKLFPAISATGAGLAACSAASGASRRRRSSSIWSRPKVAAALKSASSPRWRRTISQFSLTKHS